MHRARSLLYGHQRNTLKRILTRFPSGMNDRVHHIIHAHRDALGRTFI